MYLIDTTLREGLQRHGLYLDHEQKKTVLLSIAALGVEEIEIGVAGLDTSVESLLAWARDTTTCKLAVWARCRVQDVELAASMGPDRLSLCMPVSDRHIRDRLGIDRDGLLERIAAALEHARGLGLPFVSLGMEDASRADPAFLEEIVLLAQDCGAHRIRVSDTLGIWNPVMVCTLISRLRAVLSVHLGVHCHNDFGMATANSIAALMSGADFADTSLLGLGERVGLAPLEELISYAHFHLQQEQYALTGLTELCRWMETLCGYAHDPFRPITGEKIFFTETGLHVEGQYKLLELFDPFPPDLLGHIRRLDVGAKSGLGAVTGKLRELGLRDDFNIEQLLRRVRTLSTLKGAPLEASDIISLANRMSRLKPESSKPTCKDLT